MSLMSYVRLARPNKLFTAFADVWAGFFLAFAAAAGPALTQHDFRMLFALLVSSGCIYSAGMIFNDVFDIERDRRLHPDRALVSGEVAMRPAVIFGAVLQVIGVASAALVGMLPLAVAAGVASLTFSYNGKLKRYRIPGSLNMGACRFGNMLLGMSPFLGGLPSGDIIRQLCFPGFLGLYVVATTLISTLEDERHPRALLGAFLGFQLAVIAGLAGFLLTGYGWQTGATIKTVAVLGTLAVWLILTSLPAFKAPDQASIGRVVRVSLTGIIVFDAAMLMGAGDEITILAAKGLVLFLIPTYLIGRVLSKHSSGGRIKPGHSQTNRSS